MVLPPGYNGGAAGRVCSVTLVATDNGDGTLTIGIDQYSDANSPPVGIALILDPNSDAIESIQRGQPTYDIITTIDPNSYQITAFAALATLGESDAFPAQVTNLFTLDFGGAASGVILGDSSRGGMVDSQGWPMTSGDLPLAFTVTVDCFPSEHPDYNAWVLVGKPACWCHPTQCHGDADGLEVTATKTVPAHYVGTPDLIVLTTGWKVATGSMTLAMMCADFDHTEVAATKTVPAHRVGTPDLTILTIYWKNTSTPTDCPWGTVTP
jgi:hypothetical protein